MLPPPLDRMLNELEVDHAFGPGIVAALRAALRLLDREADDNPDALAALQALALLAAEPGTARSRFEATADLAARRGKVSVTRRNGVVHIESRPS
jgi:hypothetical protein